MLNKCGRSGHPCLVPDFRGSAFSFSPLNMMLTVKRKQCLKETCAFLFSLQLYSQYPRPPKCISIERIYNEMLFTIRKKEILPFVTIPMELEGMIL